MNNQLKIKIAYKNKHLETVSQKTYQIDEYCSMLKSDLIYLIHQVQDAFYDKNDFKKQQSWSTSDIIAFQKIRHKLLDVANSIDRITQNIIKE